MAMYRIKVESIDGSEVMDEVYVNGIECDGFVIMADNVDSTSVAIHKTSIMNIAKMISKDENLMNASKLAALLNGFIKTMEKDDPGDFMKQVLAELGQGEE